MIEFENNNGYTQIRPSRPLVITTGESTPFESYTSYEDCYNNFGLNSSYHFALIQSNYNSGSNMTTHFVQSVNGAGIWYFQLRYNFGNYNVNFIAHVYFQNGFTNSSDRRLKRDIEYIDEQESVNIITKLKPATFNYVHDDETRAKRHGLIAQDVQEVIPDLVGETLTAGYEEKKHLTLDYLGLIPHLINTIKWQKKQIDELTNRIQTIEKLIESINPSSN